MKNLIFYCILCCCVALTLPSCTPEPVQSTPVNPNLQGVCVPTSILSSTGVLGGKWEYDAQHRLSKWYYYSSGAPYAFTTITYSAAGKITTLKTYFHGSTNGIQNITYDASGNAQMIETTDSNNVLKYRNLYFYDTNYRIYRTERYSADSTGNMLLSDYFTCAYIGNSRRPNHVERVIGTYSYTFLYEYDIRNNMTKVSQYQNGTTTPNQVDTYTYDTSKSWRTDFVPFASFRGLPPENYYNGQENINNILTHKIESKNISGILYTVLEDHITYPNFNSNNYPSLLSATTHRDTVIQNNGTISIIYDCY